MAQTQKEKEQIKRDIELNDIKVVLSTPEGRRFYWRVMEAGTIFGDIFCGEEQSYTNRNLGRRDVSLKFFNDLFEADPNAYVKMQRERSSRDKMDESDIKEDIKNKTVLDRQRS